MDFHSQLLRRDLIWVMKGAETGNVWTKYQDLDRKKVLNILTLPFTEESKYFHTAICEIIFEISSVSIRDKSTP